jgi:hypothetical protein
MKRLLGISLAVILGLGLSVVATPVLAADVSWYRHTVDASYYRAASLYATDINGDGFVDVLVASYGDDEIVWWENSGGTPPTWTKRTVASGFDSAESVYATDINGDTFVDVIGAAGNDNEIAWWENDGNSTPTWTKHTITSDFLYACDAYAIDVNGDTFVDVVGAGWDAEEIAWWENDGSQNFTKYTIASGLSGIWKVYATDINGDTFVDVLGADWTGDEIFWCENDGSQNFTKHTVGSSFYGACSVYATDVNDDTFVDVLGTAYDGDEIVWWENDGSQNFTKHTIDGSFDGAYCVKTTDINDDGFVDVLGAAYHGNEIAWWENSGGTSPTWTKHTLVSSFGRPIGAYAANVDGDLDLDVVGAAQTDNEIAWWENIGEPDVQATIRVVPNKVKMGAGGKWVRAYIELPEGYNLTDIDANSILFNYSVPAVTDAKLARMGVVKFDKLAVKDVLGVGDQVEIKVTGKVDGNLFEGSATMKVRW